MTVIIEARKINRVYGGFRRYIKLSDGDTSIISQAIHAKTREELEVIDHENFMKE